MGWKKWAFLAVSLGGLALAGWAFVWEPRSLVIRSVEAVLPAWPQSHGTVRIALLSDLHVGSPWIDRAALQRVVAAINREQPDIVVLLGDYTIHGVVGGRYQPIESFAGLLGEFEAPLGTYAVLGNHDWWDDAAAIRKGLEAVGITVLDDELRAIARPGGAFWLAGVADYWEGRPDIPALMRQIGDQAPVIAATHNPDIFPAIPPRVALTLAGHSHGGQVNLPLVGRLVVPSQYGARYAQGHVEEGGRHLFVTTGLGTSILPVRFRVPPEAVILTIRPGA